MSKSIILAALSALLLFPAAAAAEDRGEQLKQEINEYQQEQEQKENEAEEKQEELSSIESDVETLEAEVAELDEEMAETGRQIREKEEEIEETEARAEALRQEIAELEETIAERDEVLKERVRSMHQNGGGVNYLEVILGAQNFGDLIERISVLHNIASQDRSILEDHIADMERLEEAKTALEEELASLEEQRTDLESMQASLEEQAEQKNAVMESLQEKGYNLEANLLSIEEEKDLLAAQEQAAASELEEWEEEQRRLEEERRLEEQRKKEEAERRAREEAAAEREREQAAEQEASAAAEEAEEEASPEPAASSSGGGAVFHRPADGSVSSHYNKNRTHPVTGEVRAHNGTDYDSSGGLNIYAAESGTVISAGRMSGYGNTVLVSHVIDGKPYTTLYAHLADMSVSAGDRVGRGERIATMGTTGVSTGVHLHFEVHPGGYAGGSSAVNPMSYLP
nr:peptidoglycan DD-metalloendopeptidase family protein [Alkalicoccus urumqiensis]